MAGVLFQSWNYDERERLMPQFWDWGFAINICLPPLLRAVLVTLKATFIGYGIALIVGLVIAILRQSKNSVINALVREAVDVIRSTPLLVQIYFLYFVGPKLGLQLSAWVTGMVVLGLHYGCYTSEVYRAGLNSINRGQWEAAIALNLSSYRTYSDIILPQMVRRIVPPLGNYLISIFKETPLLSAISIFELMAEAKVVGSEYYRFMEPVTLVGIFFLAMSLSAAGLIYLIERWFRASG